MRKTLFTVGILITVMAVIWWLTRLPEPGTTQAEAPVTPPTPPATPATVPSPSPEPAAERANEPLGIPETVDQTRPQLAHIYSYAGELKWDETKALVEKREQRRQALVKQLGELGPGAAQSMAERYSSALSIREKTVYIEALGKSQDPDAVAMLTELLARETSFALQKEIVTALGQRPEPEAQMAVSRLLAGAENANLRFVAAQSLAGDEAALPDLAARVRIDANPEVQKESIGGIGAIGTEAALQELAAIAHGTTLPADVRKTAIQEMARSFQEKALPGLHALAEDANPEIRMNVARALARIPAAEATASREPADKSSTTLAAKTPPSTEPALP